MTLLRVNGLSISYATRSGGCAQVVRDVGFHVVTGETVGLVGESGSGKSQTALALLGLLGPDAQVEGRIEIDGMDYAGASERGWRAVRGREVAMIFQDPMTALTPHLSIGDQLVEPLRQHRGTTRRTARAEALRMLDAVRIPAASRRISQYPHEFSGGMRQRVMIAMALMGGPRLLIADEPTTALDVTIQAQILDLLRELRREFGLAIVLISHDIDVVGAFCDRLMVMYGGALMEAGPAAAVLDTPGHPYTAGLLDAQPDIVAPRHARLPSVPGHPPPPDDLPPGCPYQARCALAEPGCEGLSARGTDADGMLRACVQSIELVEQSRIAPTRRGGYFDRANPVRE